MTLLLATLALSAPTMKTPWTDLVDRKLPHAEYPRPTMVRKEWVNLNGPWDYAIRPAGEDAPASFDGKILVPFPVESQLSGVQKPLKPDQTLWYERTITLPESWKGQRVLLHFGAVDHNAEVFVNGKSVAKHVGGYDPFSVDVTDRLAKGKQTLAVAVQDGTDSAGQPRGKQVLNPGGIFYTPTSGIWQTVWMEPVPKTSIASYRAVPDLKAGGVRVTVDAPKGTVVEAQVRLEGKTVAKAGFSANAPYLIPVPDAKLWSPESPTLYDLKLTLLEKGKKADSVDAYFGMREMKLGKDKAGVTRLFLNGKPYFQYGPLDQGFWPDGLYTAPTDDALKFDIEASKKMGCNMLRKHVKVEPERLYYWCDKLGLLVWQDMPSGNYGTPEAQANYEKEWASIIRARGNHPSIVMWIPFNEGWGQFDTERIVAFTKKADPSRLVNNASGWTDKGVGDVLDIHSYPGPSAPQWEPKRAAVLGEFGGLGLPVEGHTWVDKNNWGYVTYKNQMELTDAYVTLLERTRDLIPTGLSAAVYTQTTDVEVECNGWLTYDRKVWKIDPTRASRAAKALYGPLGTIETVVPTRQSWRYTTSDPGKGWEAATFDDSAWNQGKASFGTPQTPNAQVGTEWTTDDIWIRRTVALPAGAGKDLRLWIFHDEDAEVFINGVLAASPRGYTTSFVIVPISPEAAKAIRAGNNVVAVHCRQTRGGQNLDCGLVRVVR